ncbi:MAG: MFS transporter [Candidatus Latescibacteria bacterium]|nr:MFS transporter [Candidatus Latescibacterota bacterium]
MSPVDQQVSSPSVDIANKATSINLFSLKTRQMRAFHMSWFSFYLCFFAWFGIAPLMAIVRDELSLTKVQVGNTIIASVAITILARFAIGFLCDRIGPRLCYTWLLILGSIPVMGIGLAQDYETFLLFRLAIGGIGASFVITQYHTSVMFAPNCVGTANATSAGWGNLGGGVTQIIMPLIFAVFIALGFGDFWSWRLSMVVAGVVCIITGIAYYFFTTDLPDGNFKELRAQGKYRTKEKVSGTFWEAAKDRRVWALFLIYGTCFGIELTINNIAALYFKDYFGLGLKTAGLVAGLFGLMNIFARTTGGIIGDLFGQHAGLKGRVRWLFIALCVEGVALMVFSQMKVLPIAIGSMIVFSLFVQMSEGATYSVVPFINKRALGSVAGIVGAGGNMGAVCAGFLFRSEALTWPQALLILGVVVFCFSFLTYLVTFEPEAEAEAKKETDRAVQERKEAIAGKERGIDIPMIPEMLSKLQPMDILRVYLGIVLALKGIYFILNMDEVERLAGGVGLMEDVVAWFVVFAHVVGGACLAIGFVTRLSAGLNAAVLLGAIMFVHSNEGLFAASQGLQLSLFALVTLLLLIWRGSGRYSVDHLFKT